MLRCWQGCPIKKIVFKEVFEIKKLKKINDVFHLCLNLNMIKNIFLNVKIKELIKKLKNWKNLTMKKLKNWKNLFIYLFRMSFFEMKNNKWFLLFYVKMFRLNISCNVFNIVSVANHSNVCIKFPK